MRVSYYPGCSLEGMAREYSESLQAVATALDIQLDELPDWTCCGASSAHVVDEGLALSLAARNLAIAERTGQDLLVPCAACFQRLKKAERDIQAGKRTGLTSPEWSGRRRIVSAAEFFCEDVGEKVLAARVKRSLAGLHTVCYYGCLTTRPPKVTGAVHPEDPRSLDSIMLTLGAGVRDWAYKTDCCGGSLMFTHPELAGQMMKKLFDMALEAGADCLVVGCPMCHSNLDTRQAGIRRGEGSRYDLPVYYFTELMALAFGDLGVEKWLDRHITDARTLLREKGLLSRGRKVPVRG